MTGVSASHSARRYDRLGVHSLDHVALSVPDLGEAQRFFECFGLDVDASSDHLLIRAYGDDHVWMEVETGLRKCLRHVSLGAFEDDLPRLSDRLADAGVALLPITSTNSLWFRDPVGMLVEVKVAAKLMPDDKIIVSRLSSPAGERGAAMRGDTDPVRPLRMAHALFFTPDIAASVDFYTKILGLRISDYPGPVAFLHGPHGSDHHLIAFAASENGVGFHHGAWDVNTLDDVGLGASQMAAAGYRKGWGLGRHVLGSNYFHYARDPWGSYAEYSFDIDFIPAEQDWPASFPAPENSLFLWGPEVPADFVTNYENAEILFEEAGVSHG